MEDRVMEPEKNEIDQDALAALSAVLDAHRKAISAVPGVSGSGVGFSSGGEKEVVIQIFVRPGMDEGLARREVEGILGTEPPFEVLSMPIPAAD